MRIFSFLLFFSILCVVGFGLHYYFWVRLVRAPELGEPWTQIGRWSLIILGILIPLNGMLHRFLPRDFASPLAWLSYLWMGAAFYLFLTTFAADLARFVAEFLMKMNSEPIWDEDRRRLLARVTAGAAGLSTGAATVLAARSATEIKVEEVEVKIERLPKALEGLSIVQMSDIHIGPILDKKFLENIVSISNGLKPDVVAITGDMVDGSVAQLGEHVAPLANLKGRFGNYFITGNHEYYSGADSWLKEVRRIGLTTLENEHVMIGDDSAKIVLAGVNDFTAGRFSANAEPDVQKALMGTQDDDAVILLAHQPKEIDNAAKAKVDLQISGHTHGGQIWPFVYAVKLAQPYVAGLYQHNERTQIYVNRGTGFWGPPMRLGAPAEITKIVLTSS